jgi:glc operon protein GlcG
MHKGFKFLTAATLLAASLAAQAQLVDKKALTLAEARKAVVAATAEAKANGWNVVIVVADDAGYPLTIDRLDNAQRPSVDIAIGKARTAALFKRPSAALEEAINKGRTALLSVDGQVFLQGGVPIVVNGEVIGAVGVSGVRADQDEQVATAGAKAINR